MRSSSVRGALGAVLAVEVGMVSQVETLERTWAYLAS